MKISGLRVGGLTVLVATIKRQGKQVTSALV